MKGKRFTKIISLLLIAMFGIPSIHSALTIDSISFKDNLSESAYDIRGVINENCNISTTFSSDGYEVYFKVGNSEVALESYTNGSTITNNGVELKITGTVSQENKKVDVVYNIKNVSDETKQYAIATTADVELADNDKAAIFKDETSIVQITQDDNTQGYEDSYGTQVKIDFSPVANTTWIGYYGDRNDKKYVNGEVKSYTFDDQNDTGLAFSWNGSLAAGEETSKTASYTIRKAETGRISFYKMGEEQPFQTLIGVVGGSILTLESPSEVEYGYKFYWNTKPDGTGTNYETNKGIIVTSGEMKLYEYNKSLWHDTTINPTDGMDFDDDNFKILEFLADRNIIKKEENAAERCVYIYNNDGKLLFTIDRSGKVKLAEGLSYKDNIVYALTEEDKELLADDDIYIEKVALIFVEKVEYKILDGDNQTYVIKSGKDIIVKANGDLSKFEELKIDDKTISKENYTLESGSTIVTIKTAYLDTLSEGDHTLVFVYDDGDVSTNLKVEKRINGPETGDNIVILVSLIVISMLGVTGTVLLKKKSK